jgi:hypothetical protein
MPVDEEERIRIRCKEAGRVTAILTEDPEGNETILEEHPELEVYIKRIDTDVPVSTRIKHFNQGYDQYE